MGFFDNLRAKRAAHRDEDEAALTPFEAADYIIGIMRYMFFRSHINRTGTDLIYDEDDCKMNAPYDSRLKHIIKLMHRIQSSAYNKGNKWQTDDIRCEFADIDPYLDGNGVRHSHILIFYAWATPSVEEIAASISTVLAHRYVIRSEVLDLYKDYTTWRLSYFETADKMPMFDYTGRRENEVVLDFYIQHTNRDTRPWANGKAAPAIWEQADHFRFLATETI